MIDIDTGGRRGTVSVMHFIDYVGRDRLSGLLAYRVFGMVDLRQGATFEPRICLFVCVSRSTIEDQGTAEGRRKKTHTYTHERNAFSHTDPHSVLAFGGFTEHQG